MTQYLEPIYTPTKYNQNISKGYKRHGVNKFSSTDRWMDRWQADCYIPNNCWVGVGGGGGGVKIVQKH